MGSWEINRRRSALDAFGIEHWRDPLGLASRQSIFPGSIEAALPTDQPTLSGGSAPGLFGRNRTAGYADPAARHGISLALAGPHRTDRLGDIRPAAAPANIGQGSITSRTGIAERLGGMVGGLAEPLLGNKIGRVPDPTPWGAVDALRELNEAIVKRYYAGPSKPEATPRPALQRPQSKPEPAAVPAPRITIRELSELSEIYESSNRGVATISTGENDPGGISYGRHQLSSKEGMMAAFLKSKHGKPFAKFFTGTRPATGEFDARYLKVAASHAEAFDEAQGQFLKENNYDHLEKYARSKGIDTSNITIMKVLWSQSLQHGLAGNKKIIDKAVKKADLRSPESTIRALYDERGKYAIQWVPPRASTKRYEKELPTALEILKRNSQ